MPVVFWPTQKSDLSVGAIKMIAWQNGSNNESS